MPRDSRVYLEDILAAAANIRTYVSGLTREGFGQDRKTVDAVVRNLEAIGEAVKQLPADVRAGAPEDLDIVWDVVVNKLPDLERRVGALLE